MDWRFNYASGGWIPFETDENGVDITPPSAEGSPYHEMMDKIKESEEERESYWSNEDGPGENALENREDYKEYEKGREEFLNYHKKIGGIITDKNGNPDPDGYYYEISISTFKGSDWEKDRAKWKSLFNKSEKMWSSSYGAWKKDMMAASKTVGLRH